MIPHTGIAEVVPLAPAGGAAALGALGLLAFLGFLVATGMLKAYSETLGAFIRWLAGKINVSVGAFGHAVHPFASVSRGLFAVDKQIHNAFAALALRSENAAAWCFSTAGHLFWWSVHETADLAADVLSAIQRTTVQTIPAAVRRAEAATLARLRGIDATIGRIEAMARAQLKRLQVGIDRMGHRLEAKITTAVHGVGARVGRLERTAKSDAQRLARVEAKWKVAAFTAAVGLALERILGKWVRCPALGRAGRKIGCRGFSLLDDLLALSFVPLLLTDACKLVHEIERLAVKVQPEIAAFVLGIEGFLCGGPSSLPSAIEPSDLKRVSALPSGL